MGVRKQFCVRGHNTYAFGRDLKSRCLRCRYEDHVAERRKDPQRRARCTKEARRREPEKFRRRARIRQGIKNLPLSEPPSGHPCDICDEPVRVPRCDHNHKTGNFRGWLCNSCNTGLGHLEKPGWLHQANAYLLPYVKTLPSSSK